MLNEGVFTIIPSSFFVIEIPFDKGALSTVASLITGHSDHSFFFGREIAIRGALQIDEDKEAEEEGGESAFRITTTRIRISFLKNNWPEKIRIVKSCRVGIARKVQVHKSSIIGSTMPTVRIGLIGKTNTGKTTFFNAATAQSVEMSNYPFTTKSPNSGMGHAATVCVHRELGFKTDNPRNSVCVDGWRQIPIEIIDLPGLIRGAWEGKGLGNQFLSVAAQSDALLHIVDASGSIDAEGKIASPGAGDPVADIADIEQELAMWYLKLIENNLDKIVRSIKSSKATDFSGELSEIMHGVGVRREHVVETLRKLRLEGEDAGSWTSQQRTDFAWTLREISKPTLIVANKIDVPEAAKNFSRIREAYSDMIVVPE